MAFRLRPRWDLDALPDFERWQWIAMFLAAALMARRCREAEQNAQSERVQRWSGDYGGPRRAEELRRQIASLSTQPTATRRRRLTER
jgi:ribosomal protein L29